MDLHTSFGAELNPDRVVKETVDAYPRAFARLTGTLDLAIQDAYARVDDRHTSKDFPGCVTSPLVRDGFLHIAQREAFAAEGITVLERGNKSIRLRTRDGRVIKVRKHPVTLRTKQLVTVTPPHPVLFGSSELPIEYTLCVLWVPNAKSQTLSRACLAAVANLDDAPLTCIYAATPLPEKSLLTTATPPVNPPQDDQDWDEEFRVHESTGDLSV